MSWMNSNDKLKAARKVQQALRKNPNDIESLLQLAALLGSFKNPDLAQKRNVLNRILSLEPTHRQARAMLFEMDRAAMGVDPARLSAAVILSDPSKNNIAEKPLVLRYSPVHQILVYLLIFLTVLVGLRVREPEVFAVFGAFLLFLMIPLWFVSLVIEISETELRISRLFGAARWEIPWREIKSFKPNPLGQGIKIITRDERVAEISSQIIGYSAIIEILRQMRPDLFDLTEAARTSGSVRESPAITSGAAKTFKKGFLSKFGLLAFALLASLLFAGTVLTAQCIPAILIAVLLFFAWRTALTNAHTARLENNRLSTRSFLKQREWTARQIRNIELSTRYNYRGIARTSIEIELQDGASFRLSGFPQGNESMYGLLKSWWSESQSL
jgi:hypothetical protein